MTPQRRTRSFLTALAILFGVLAVAAALAFSADTAHSTEVELPPLEQVEHSFDDLEPPGTTPGTAPDTAPPEAGETEAHAPAAEPVRVAPHYTG